MGCEGEEVTLAETELSPAVAPSLTLSVNGVSVSKEYDRLVCRSGDDGGGEPSGTFQIIRRGVGVSRDGVRRAMRVCALERAHDAR